MLRNVCVFLFLGVTGVVLSASTNVNPLPCPTVRPTNTSVEQVLGDWYFQEITVGDRIPQVQLCNIVEIRDIHVSDSGVKSFSFLLFQIRNGTEKHYVFNKTLEVSTECPGHWITKEKDGYTTVAAETEARKLICLVTPMKGGGIATFILSRDEEPQTSQLQDIKNKMKAAGIVAQGHVITRNGTLC